MPLFLLVLLGGLLCGAWVSRWRERRVLPIWTWALAFALAWSWTLYRVGAWAWAGPDARISALALVALPVGFLTCVVAAMTAGRGRVK